MKVLLHTGFGVWLKFSTAVKHSPEETWHTVETTDAKQVYTIALLFPIPGSVQEWAWVSKTSRLPDKDQHRLSKHYIIWVESFKMN